jgi:hypothetical protein
MLGRMVRLLSHAVRMGASYSVDDTSGRGRWMLGVISEGVLAVIV